MCDNVESVTMGLSMHKVVSWECPFSLGINSSQTNKIETLPQVTTNGPQVRNTKTFMDSFHCKLWHNTEYLSGNIECCYAR